MNKCEIDIKKFKKCKRLNKGGFGVVYKIEEIETGEFYAAKVIDCGDDEEQCNKMIEREVEIMICAKNPTIIKFIGYSKLDFQNEYNITIIMELAKNGSLASVIKSIQNNNGPKDYSNTSRQIILVGIARGMKYLHDHNIIHRDLKTENILLDENFHPLITDFGMSKIFEEGHSYSQSQFGGTIPYEAPEILKNIPYDRKVDVYSFGILMFEVITDSFPYPELESRKISDLDFRYKVANEGYRPKFNITINENLKQLIEECWSEDPKVRPTFDDIFKKLSYLDDHNFNQYFIGDIDVDEFKLYIDDIFDPTEFVSDDKSNSAESEIQKLKKENLQLKSENDQNIKKIKDYEEEIQNLKNDYMKIKAENEQYVKRIQQYEEEISKLKTEKKQDKDNKNKDNKNDQENKNENEDIKNDQKNKNLNSENDQENKNDQESHHVEEIEKLNESDDIIISDFNNFNLEMQKSVSEKLSEANCASSNYFSKIAKILEFISDLNQVTDSCIEISSKGEQLLSTINEEPRILLRSKATEVLFNANLLNSTDFLNISSQFNQVSIEIKYPSDSYKNVIDSIKKILALQAYKDKFTVALFITGIEEIAGQIYNSKIISYVRIDDCVKRIIGSYNVQGPFQQCTSLIEVRVPSSLTRYGINSFRGCKSLKRIEIPSSVTEIECGFFRECSSLSSINIPSSVTKINDHAFDECTSLTEVSIPSSVTYMGNKTFADCTALLKISLSSSVHSIGRLFFYRCSSLSSITIPSSVSSIGENAFGYCTSLTEVVIPSSVSSIDECAFIGCSSLKKVTIPFSVIVTRGGIFSKCFNLEQINIQKVEVENEGKGRSYRVIRELIKYIDNNFLISKSNINSDVYDVLLFVKKCSDTLTIPSFITKIESYTFLCCSSLTKVIIPPSVTVIGKSAFCGCSSLKEISLPSSLTKIQSCCFNGCSSLTEIVIPSSVSLIESTAFGECSSLTEIVIPSSVHTIESHVFDKCSSLTKVTIPSSVTSIPYDIFNKCASLKEVTIPSSVKEIKNDAFRDCSSLKQISIPSGLQVIESSVFCGCESLVSIEIPSSVTEIGFSAFSGCSSLTKLTILSSGLKEIGSSFVSGCSSLTEISIPSSVATIGYSAFSRCSLLKKITIPSSVVKIGNSAFSECSSLEKVLFESPSKLKEIESSLFRKCIALVKIDFPSSVVKIGNSVLRDCSALKQISIPSSVTSIDGYCFDGCTALEQITIPSSVTSVGECVFRGCTSLMQITIPRSLNTKSIYFPPKAIVNRV